METGDNIEYIDENDKFKTVYEGTYLGGNFNKKDLGDMCKCAITKRTWLKKDNGTHEDIWDVEAPYLMWLKKEYIKIIN